MRCLPMPALPQPPLLPLPLLFLAFPFPYEPLPRNFLLLFCFLFSTMMAPFMRAVYARSIDLRSLSMSGRFPRDPLGYMNFVSSYPPAGGERKNGFEIPSPAISDGFACTFAARACTCVSPIALRLPFSPLPRL